MDRYQENTKKTALASTAALGLPPLPQSLKSEDESQRAVVPTPTLMRSAYSYKKNDVRHLLLKNELDARQILPPVPMEDKTPSWPKELAVADLETPTPVVTPAPTEATAKVAAPQEPVTTSTAKAPPKNLLPLEALTNPQKFMRIVRQHPVMSKLATNAQEAALQEKLMHSVRDLVRLYTVDQLDQLLTASDGFERRMLLAALLHR